ncbi:MAG: hypothetical protein NC347_14605 [Clostridium sp.]|nr:hypothetical protein [Clostridium sp.]
MTIQQIEGAFNEIIKTFNEEAGVAISYCPSDEMSTPLAETHKALSHALDSIKNLIIADKQG